MSRVGARAAQAVRDSVGRSVVKDRAQQLSVARAKSSAAPQQAGKMAAAEAGRRSAAEEESLRTLMFLSMWGPNA